MPLVLVTTVIFLLSGCSTLGTTPPGDIDLSGTWILDAGVSDPVDLTPNRQGQRARPGGGAGSRGMPGGGGRGMPGGGGGGGGRGMPGGRGSGRGGASKGGASGMPRMTPVMTAEEMTIEQNDDSMGVAYPDGRYRDVSWGKREKEGVKIDAGWDEETLVIRSDGERMDVKESYVLSASGDRLTLELVVKGPMGKREFTRVFIREGSITIRVEELGAS